MGIVNVTPDSFSDGGLWFETDQAIAHAEQLIAEGASIVDIGGESTRPGSQPLDEQTELDRVIPVIAGIAERLEWVAPELDHIEISIDTVKPAVAEAAVDAGATIINDVSAKLEKVAAATDAGWVAMHSPGPSSTMQDDPYYDDVVAEVGEYLADALARGRAARVSRMWIDPGIGFGKTLDHNLELLARLGSFVRMADAAEAGVMVGVSRKRSIGELHARADGVEQIGEGDRLEGSVALAVWSSDRGADLVRVHDVQATLDALSVVAGDREGQAA